MIIFPFLYFTRGYLPNQRAYHHGTEVIDCGDHGNFFVKVYMEGIPIGRKLNLVAHDGYHELVRTLENMFDTTILCKLSITFLLILNIEFVNMECKIMGWRFIIEQGAQGWMGCNQRGAMC